MKTERTLQHQGAWPTGARPGALELGRFALARLDAGGSEAFEAGAPRCRIGGHPSNDLVIEHETVSRFHCTIEVDERGARVRDEGSLNGTVVDGVRVEEAWLKDGSVLQLGGATLRFAWSADRLEVKLSDAERFGALVGRSVAMRRAFALLERCAGSEATVLITGETGTGKEGAAEGIHEAGARAERPFIVIDCASIPPNLIESELFGHERGAFTGADKARAGAFELADGGTVFLDEIGELPMDLQPKLLRVIEQRTLRRLGGHARLAVDVRVIAATHRSLTQAVNEGTFRSDLYYRLAVLQVELPPLRARLDDLEPLVDALLARMNANEATRERLLAPGHLRRLRGASWPGNVRELRNHLERAVVLEGALEPPKAEAPELPFAIDPTLSWSEARQRAIDAFERHHLAALLALHDDNVSKAARAAEMDRVYLHRLLRRHRLR